ncbi:MAG TPA: helix-turn-helix domain-containing protein, partial [Clostridia bacterium]|nr:helix-turn-helix domain-containing protein [Clostridia bacterium]
RRLDAQLCAVVRINGLMAANPLISQIYKATPTLEYPPDGLCDVINSYCNTSSLIHDIYLYGAESRGVYARSTFLLFEFYKRENQSASSASRYLTLDGMPYLDAVLQPDHFGRFMAHTLQMGAQIDRDVVLYSMSIYKSGGAVTLLSTVEILPSSLSEFLDIDAAEGYHAATLLVSKAHGVIAFVGNPEPLTRDPAFSEAIAESASALRLGGARYLLQYARSNVADWTAVVVTDTQRVTRYVLGRLTGYFLLLAVILAAGIVLLAMVLHANYTPVYEIYAVAQDYVHSLQTGGGGAPPEYPLGKRGPRKNEIQTIHQAIDDLQSRVLHLSNEMKDQHGILEQRLWMDVINKALTDPAVFAQRAALLGLDDGATRYRILVTFLDGTIAQADAAHKQLGDHLRRYGKLTRLSVGTLHRTPWLMAFPEEDPFDKTIFAQVVDALLQELGVPVLLGVGRMAQDFRGLSDSYFEAFASMDFSLMTGQRVSFYEDIRHAPFRLDRSFDVFAGNGEKLAEALSRGDMASMREAFQRLEQTVVAGHLPINNVRRICFDAHTAIVEALRAAQKPVQPIVSVNLVMELFHINFIDDARSFLENLEQLIAQCLSLCSGRIDMDAAIKRIHDEFANPNFSFNALAAEMQVSNSSFSRCFSAQIGVLPIDYLTNLRMEKAKELLTDTGIPIASVMQAVGYFSLSSFSKRFKSFTNVTPSEYRALHGETSARDPE